MRKDPFFNQTAYIILLYYIFKTVCHGDRIKQKVHHVVWSLLCVCVCVFNFEREKKCIPKILLAQDRYIIYAHRTCVEHTRRVAVLGI